MEVNHVAVFGSWLRVLCPTCLTEKDRALLSARTDSEKEKFGFWLKFLCPTCRTEKHRTSLSAESGSGKEKFGTWLKFLCPTCLTGEPLTREGRPLIQAFMSSGNCL
jgi:hypothetical protein